MAVLTVARLAKTFNEVRALDHVSFEFGHGILSILGPSGCGKTTLLRSIAGLEVPDEGRIDINGKVQTWIAKGIHVPPYSREIGFVFQNYALWPHMTVYKNVAFGLNLRRLPREEIKRRVQRALELVGLEGYDPRYPSQLSGGQQQRVALARSLVMEPQLILLDEPLSNLDAKLREEMRIELRKLIKKVNISAVYVTHDQEEAFTISDSVIIMDRGRIVQYGTPNEIYEKPANEFVASFIGHSLLVNGQVLRIDGRTCVFSVPEFGGATLTCSNFSDVVAGQACKAVIRTNEIKLNTAGSEPHPNSLRGTLLSREYRGGVADHRVLVGKKEIVVTSHRMCPLVDVSHDSGAVFLYIDPAAISLIGRAQGNGRRELHATGAENG
ncbi:MAG TPA: ABC transporter ATP-binding protein [Candidatus Acidoferrales bacterium]|nr:ABC transporter ATP-binding protein [Candidatus Acidoferrales bacterium]